MHGYAGIPLLRESAAQQLAHGLAEKITTGEIKAGEALREGAIASALHISRNTVREAIRLLEQSGLVRHELHHGTVVVEPSVEELKELYLARRHLEVAAVSLQPTTAGLENLRHAFAALSKAAQERDAIATVRKDLDFHAAVVALLGSRRIDAMFEGLTRELQFYLMVLAVEDREHERPDDLIAEHKLIYDAILARTTREAADAVTAHIDQNRDRLIAILQLRDR